MRTRILPFIRMSLCRPGHSHYLLKYILWFLWWCYALQRKGGGNMVLSLVLLLEMNSNLGWSLELVLYLVLLSSEAYRRVENSFFPLLFWCLILFLWWQMLCKYLREMLCAVRRNSFKMHKIQKGVLLFWPFCTDKIHLRNWVQGYKEHIHVNLNSIFCVIFDWIWKS